MNEHDEVENNSANNNPEPNAGLRLGDLFPTLTFDNLQIQTSLQPFLEQTRQNLASGVQSIIQGLAINALNSFQETFRFTFQDAITQSLNAFQESLTANIQSIIKDSLAGLDASNIFSSLPDLSLLIREWDRLESELKKTDYHFTIHLDIWTIRALRNVAAIDPRVREAVVKNRLLFVTKHPSFTHEMHQVFNSSAILRRRWGIKVYSDLG